MRRKKHKHTRRAVLFYKINHGFRPPYRVLLDSNFMHAVMLAKIGDPAEILSKLLGAPVKVSTTKCVLHELHSMGEEFADTLRACRKIPKLTCAHDGEPVAAADCIASLIGVSNAEHFFVATQDRRLRSALSSNSGGGPSLFVSVNGLHLEEPSQAQHKQAKQAEQEHMAVKDHERSAPALQALAASSATRQERSIFRRKGAKGPNPLSRPNLTATSCEMFVYLSKKIAIPNSIKLRCLGWNGNQGWIACGGEGGLLKVLQLDGAGQVKEGGEGAAGVGNLSMNQSLEGHKEAVVVLAWNDAHGKLTSSDQSGLIIVWILHKGMWFEEMINNRNKSVVRDMRWTADGQKICIVYEDGAIIVGGVDGNRLWGKELELQLALVEWAPDSRRLLFATTSGECHVYDGSGNAITRMQLACMEGYAGASQIVGLDWYSGLEGYCEPGCPSLAICMANGRLQLMRSDTDDACIVIDSGMRATGCKWCHNGAVLAVSGSSSTEAGHDVSLVQFFAYNGQHLRMLRVPGSGITSMAWEAGSLRLALSVDSHIYFATVRPNYMWAYFADTLVYAYSKPDRPEHCVVFWDLKTSERHAKYVKRLVSIKAAGNYCVLATREEAGQAAFILYLELEPTHLAMSPTFVVSASASAVYMWQYSTDGRKLTTEMKGDARKGSDERERVLRIDDTSASPDTSLFSWKASSASAAPTNDPIAAVCTSDAWLLVGRQSGTLHRYTLPGLTLAGKHQLRCEPERLALNCDASRMAIVDTAGGLSFYDFSPAGAAGGEHLAFERKDVWDVVWSSDDPALFAMMEKARMYIFRGLDPEEPVQSSACLCRFHDLEVTAVNMDDVMSSPDGPEPTAVLQFEVRSLRDARKLLETVNLSDASQYIEENAHPRLWRALAEHALSTRNFQAADKAFVRCQDYQGIQFVKHLQRLDSEAKQAAEIAIYFKRFDEAEGLYHGMDRPDLAIDMRMRLGDWFTVEKLVRARGGDDARLALAWNKIGDYYAERHKWQKAITYYSQAANSEALLEALYHVEDYGGLERLMRGLPDGSPLLANLGDKFQSVGLCEQGVEAFRKAGDVKRGVDCCVLLNQWDQAVALAERHHFPQIEALLMQYANNLLEKKEVIGAVQLYQKANHHTEAAQLLVQLAEAAAATKVQPLRTKQLYVLAALEVERFRKRMLDAGDSAAGATGTASSPTSITHTTTAAQTLAGLMTLEAASMGTDTKALDSAWHAAEAYHFWMLAHRQLYANNMDGAMRTALHLRRYEALLGERQVACLLALAAFYNQFFAQCSKAFMKLESLAAAPEAQRRQFADLAMSIFLKNPPNDPRSIKETREKGSGKWRTTATPPAPKDEVCVASGKIVREVQGAVRCKACKHYSIQAELKGLTICALCHTPLVMPAQPASPLSSSLSRQLSQQSSVLSKQSSLRSIAAR
ncbi:hypothetical protein WJX72_011599 [[Myrmecia] bisecta]|uniref:Uncharacterized protein n=1 Tax=[Myrmecia] bisecta TaxID=41462 RepID=A0AAW1P253_9CHLO